MATVVGALVVLAATLAAMAAAFAALAVGVVIDVGTGLVVACAECLAFALACVTAVRRIGKRKTSDGA